MDHKDLYQKVEGCLKGTIENLTKQVSTDHWKELNVEHVDKVVSALRNALDLYERFVVVNDDDSIVMVHKETLKKAGWVQRRGFPGDGLRSIVWCPPTP